ncbi:uncharacterized protein LOC130751704 [Actinidia eriantha]|uniref:uncharacterized protein LOC130751704 n=1 Tax=Actinidia eriantha TaxID=165200 RepID=UPI002583589E|nr:uncharacterized protein LOC130751704 [Actinidia eriantha]
MVGNVGIGRDDGIWVLGSGGKVGFGRVGIVGNGGGSVAVGSVGMAGNGGSVVLGRLDGGGERKGIAGIVVGIEGIAGNVGRGGRVTLGTAGMVGNVGIGRDDGIWVLGSGGNVGFGRVGILGNGGGSVAVGSVGMAGKGGSVGIGGVVWNRWRAARLVWVLEKDSTTTRERITKLF